MYDSKKLSFFSKIQNHPRWCPGLLTIFCKHISLLPYFAFLTSFLYNLLCVVFQIPQTTTIDDDYVYYEYLLLFILNRRLKQSTAMSSQAGRLNRSFYFTTFDLLHLGGAQEKPTSVETYYKGGCFQDFFCENKA